MTPSKTGTVDAFRYQSGLETMDFKYPHPDWLEGHVVVHGEFGLDLCTKFGKVTVRPGQWIVNADNGNIHVLDPWLGGASCFQLSVSPPASQQLFAGGPCAFRGQLDHGDTPYLQAQQTPRSK
jgi:hypothetical protein